MSFSPARRPWLRVVWVIGLVASIVAMALVTAEGISGLDADTFRAELMVTAAVLFGLSWIAFACGWSVLATGAHHVKTMAAWSGTQLLRYLPGAVWAPIGRAATVEGRPTRRIATVLVEIPIILGAVGIVAGPLAGIALDPVWFLITPAPLVALLVVRLAGPRFDIGLRHALTATAWRIPAWVLFAVASAAAQRAIGAGPSLAEAAAAALIAWTVGYLIVFVPAGLGAREVVYLGLLEGTAPTSQLAAGAVAGRLALTGAEVVVTLGFAALARRNAGRVSTARPTTEPSTSIDRAFTTRSGHRL